MSETFQIRIRNKCWLSIEGRGGQCKSLYKLKLLTDNIYLHSTISIDPGVTEKLQHCLCRTKIDHDAIEDVYDRELYKKHACPGGFLSAPRDIS